MRPVSKRWFYDKRATHNSFRRYGLKLRREDWLPCRETGRTMTELVREAAERWKGIALTNRFKREVYDLGLRFLRFEETHGLAYIRLINTGTKKECWELTLDPRRRLLWIDDVGHEIGHLESFRLLGDQFKGRQRYVETKRSAFDVLRQLRLEEVFADEFGIAWASVPYHRQQIRLLIGRALKRYNERRLL